MVIKFSHLLQFFSGVFFVFVIVSVFFVLYRSICDSDAHTIEETEIAHDLPHKRHSVGIGSVGFDVIEVHDRLHALGYACAQDLIGDDLYGERSQACIAVFQITNGLVPSGVVENREWELLAHDHPYDAAKGDAQRWLVPSGNGERNDMIYYSPYAKKTTYLTFNGVGSGSYVQEIIEILQKNAVPATFFLSNQELDSYAHYATLLSGDLHRVGYLVSDAKNDEEASTARSIYDDALGKREIVKKYDPSKKLLCLRPSYDMLFAEKQFILQNTGMSFIRWHVDPQNWRISSPDTVADHVIEHTQPGEIIMMSLENADPEQTLRAIEKIIRVMISDGWIFGSLQC